MRNTNRPFILSPQPAEKRKYESNVPSVGPDIIEISSDSEPEEKKPQRNHILSKKRTLSAPTNDLPSKRRLTEVEVIELLDSDDDAPTIKSEILASTIPTASKSRKEVSTPQAGISAGNELTPQIQFKGEASSTTMPPPGLNLKFEIDESAKDDKGRYVVTKKVRVDRVEHLSEVPKWWPVPPEDATVAYVIDLNEDKKWQEGTGKDKAFDRFLKQEVTFFLYFCCLQTPN